MDKNIIFVIFGYILYFAVLITLPWMRKKILAKAGECVYSFAHFDRIRTIIIYCLSFVLIGLVFLLKYSLVIRLIIEFCGIAGAYIAGKESNFTKISGIYKNGIVCSEGFFPYDDILTLPVLNLSKEEQENHLKNELIFATASKGNVQILFESEEKCEQAKKNLLEICPRLLQHN